jgi:hypothetical protein
MNTEILNRPGPPWEGDYGGVKRIRGDEPIGVVIYIIMETLQGISLCNYIYLKLAKMSCFFLIFYLFYSTKSENRRAEQDWGGGVQESDGGGNSSMTYLIHCKNLCKCHNIPPPSTTINGKNRKKI